MEIYVARQTMMFLWACGLGAALGLVYDVFRIARVAFPAGKVIIFAEDVIFFVICAGTTFFFLMGAAKGQIRGFLLIGELIGAVLYYMTVGRLVMKVSKAIIDAIKRFFRFLYRWIVLPIWRLAYRIVSILLTPFLLIWKIMKKSGIRAKYHLKSRQVVLYNQLMGHRENKVRKRQKKEKSQNGKKTGKAKSA